MKKLISILLLTFLILNVIGQNRNKEKIKGSIYIETACYSYEITFITKELVNPNVFIYNYQGVKIYQQKILESDTTLIDFGKKNLPNGIYTLVVKDDIIAERIKETLVIKSNSQTKKQVELWMVDEFPITNDMFKGSDLTKNCDEIFASEMAWFSNKTNNQILIINLYTDYFRVVSFYFDSNFIPDEIINKIEMGEGRDYNKIASFDQKKKCMDSFLDSCSVVDVKYFTSNKGVKLGDLKRNCLSLYGVADSVSIDSKGVDRMEWKFDPDWKNRDNEYDVNFKRVGVGKYGHQTIMYFRDEKLVGMILHNDIP